MNFFRSYKTVEARSAAALHLKVMSNRATGWMLDGPKLTVTDFSKNKRPITRYSQAMFKTGFSGISWGLLH
ncbi:MAG: hypothetical protein JWQ83_743 [Lacunisphaera sp.]|jgi:hypothetical protein|nr:hypothetical protein [Lacunisphaera sp.]MDB6165603.1 hypothetical protein [Lacunisphaera sp.]